MSTTGALSRSHSSAQNSAASDSSRPTTPRSRWRETNLEIQDDNVIDLTRARHERAAQQARRCRSQARAVAVVADDFAEEADSRQSTQRAQKAARRKATKKEISPCHWGLIVVVLALVVFSLPVVYSASQAIALNNHGSADYFFKRQVLFAALGIAGMLGASLLNAKSVRVCLWVLYAVSIIGLLAIEFTPLGVTMGGARRWLKILHFPFQVSEIAKVALIGVLADYWFRAAPSSQRSWWPWAGAFAIAAPMVLLVLKQPHFSAAAILFLLPIVIGFFAGAPLKQVVAIVAPLVIGMMIGIPLCKAGTMPLMKPYQQERIARFFDADAERYQTEQGLSAIERGGWLGVGPGASLYKQGHLPAPHTDFILAVVGEEIGMAGMVGLLAVYGLMILFCLQVGHVSVRPFETLLCTGVGGLLAIQVFYNVGVVLGWLPVTGVPLPLMSYGGSGMICALVSLGIVLGISRRSGQEQPAAA